MHYSFIKLYFKLVINVEIRETAINVFVMRNQS